MPDSQTLVPKIVWGGCPPGKLLLVDTCGATGSVAMADSTLQLPIAATQSLPGRTASERLVPAIRELSARTGISLHSLDAIAVVHGPGSFTGVRVGLSAAKGLCEALNLPLVAISRLAVLAYLAAPADDCRIQALLDAGRGEFYSGIYADGFCLREALLTGEEIFSSIDLPRPNTGSPGESQPSSRKIVVCEPSVAQAVAALAPQLFPEPTAPDALPLALRRLHAKEFDDPATLDANYLRRTDAEIFAKSRAALTPAANEPSPQGRREITAQ